MKTTKECLERLESKIDEIRQDLQAIHELIAKNEQVLCLQLFRY